MNRSRALLVFAVAFTAFATSQLLGARPAAAPPSLFSDIGAPLVGVYDGSVAWGDYNSDGKLDILLTGAGNAGNPVAEIYKNNGDGTFSEDTTAESVLTAVSDSSVAWGDYNADGKPDILLTGQSRGLPVHVQVSKLYRNNGNGTFSEDTTAESALIGVEMGAVAWGDYNSDGRLDILLTGGTGDGGANAVSKIYKNNGDGTFSEDTTAESDLTPVRGSSVAWGDYNADGALDILLTGLGTPENVSKIYKNNGDGTFSEDTTADSVLISTSQSSAAWSDYNSDGRPDILITGWNASGQYTTLYKNNGGLFSEDTAAEAGLTGVFTGSIAWGDYNSDGMPDILLTGDKLAWNPVTEIYRNDGDGTFSEDIFSDGGLTDVLRGSVAWGDYDSDGRLDILLTGDNGSARIAKVYKNGTAAVNTVPAAPSNLSASVGSNRVTLSWNAASDPQTPVVALTYNLRVGTTPGGSQIVSPLSLSDGTRLVPQDGSVGERTSYTLEKLSGGTYYWSVQAVDSGFAGSPFAAEGTFTMPAFAFSAAGYSASEAGGHATVTIDRTVSTVGSAAVHFAAADGTAMAGEDYTTVDQTVSFASGEDSKTVSIAIKNDTEHETSETVQLTLSRPSGATLGSPVSATLTIVDDDNGKLVSARLSKVRFKRSEARKVKLTYRFVPKSTSFAYLLSVKKGSKWVTVRSVRRAGSFSGSYKMTVKQLFGSKSVKSGRYRLRLSANLNSKLLGFRVR